MRKQTITYLSTAVQKIENIVENFLIFSYVQKERTKELSVILSNGKQNKPNHSKKKKKKALTYLCTNHRRILFLEELS